MVGDELNELIATREEWLLIDENGRSFSVLRTELEVYEQDKKTHFGFIDETGFKSLRLNGFTSDGESIKLTLSSAFRTNTFVISLVPRTEPADLAADIATAREKIAEEIASMIEHSFAGFRIVRTALNEPGGRLAVIEFDTAEKKRFAAIADVTAKMNVESVFTAAIKLCEKLGERKKKPVLDLWVIGEKRHARAMQRLHALFTEKWKSKLTILEIDRRSEPIALKTLAMMPVSSLWRAKPPKLSMIRDLPQSLVGEAIVALAPDDIDIVYSRHGESLRFRGLPFARVRTLLGIEKAWFGVGRERRPLTNDSWIELETLIDDLKDGRATRPENKKHSNYRQLSEAWLGSLVRRDISQLDGNLILSPVYDQFRAATDKIDLLALRRDGRLVIVEIKTQPDREAIFQVADYWRKIEHHRRRGILAAADLFEGREISDEPAIVYLVSPAWSIHRDLDLFAACLTREIEIWGFELHEDWRSGIKVIERRRYGHAERSDFAGSTYR